MKKILIVLILLVAGGGAASYWYWEHQAAGKTTFRFAEIKRGRLVATVGSTGTLQPRETVDVGTQVIGRVVEIGKDPNTKSGIVDWGSAVEGPVYDKDGNMIKSGTVLARIDPDLYDAAYKNSLAALEAAKYDLQNKKAILVQATADWQDRVLPLWNAEPKGVTKAEYDQVKAAFEATTANVKLSAANIEVAKANLKRDETNLNYCTITSPVNGIVIDRRVNVGQTVVSSLSAPSLFLIAKNLSQLEVWATVNEVDVGKIEVYQDVKFTVDALPGKTYRGKVVPQGVFPFRLNATMNQNVVTYTVVVSADNTDGKLKPYLTTNLSFIVADKPNALLVPNAALRWQPSKAQMTPETADAYAALRAKKRSTTDGEGQDVGYVWVRDDDGKAKFIQLKLGLSDTVNTEVLGVVGGGELAEGAKLIVAEGKLEALSGGNTNPFVATPFGTKKKD